MKQQDAQKYIDRLAEIMQEGRELAKLAEPTVKNPNISTIRDSQRLNAFYASAKNNISNFLGVENPYYAKLEDIDTKEKPFYSGSVLGVCGIIQSILTDWKKGTLWKYDFLVSGELLESVLEQAQELNDAGYKDAAAVMMRVALETSLKKLATAAGINPKQNAAKINEALKNNGIYNNIQESQIESWLRLGNHAAHGNFNEYTKEEVCKHIEAVQAFINQQLKNQTP